MTPKRNSSEIQLVIDDDSTIESVLAELNQCSANERERHENIEALYIFLARQPTVLGLTAYCKFVHEWTLQPHHIDWAKMIIAGERICIVAPPGSGKSLLLRAWCEWAIGLWHDRAIMVIGNTIKQARKTIAAVGQVIESSAEYRLIFPDVHPTGTWSREELYVDRRGLPKEFRVEPTLAAFGIDGAYQGTHVDDIIIDDPTDQKDVHSPPTMRMQREQLTGVLFDRLEKEGNLFAILTRWADNDLVPTLEQIGVRVESYPAYRDPSDPYPWDGAPFDSKHPVSLLCESMLSWEQLEAKRVAKGDNQFKLTYLNKVEGAVYGECVFPRLNKNLQYVSMKEQGRKDAKFVATRVGVDWGTTVQHQSAMVTVTKNSQQEIWVRAAWMSAKGSSDELREKLLAWKPLFNITQVHYDRSQGSLKDMLERCGVTALKGENSVDLRIGALRTLLEQNLFFIDSDGEGVESVWSQLSSYRYDDTGKVVETSDDLVDALLMALHAILDASKTGVGRPHEIARTPKRSHEFDPEAEFDPAKEMDVFRTDCVRTMKDYGV